MRTYMRSGALKALLKSVECYEVNSPVPLQTGGRLVLFSTREQLQRSSSLVLFFFSFKLSLLSLSLSLFSSLSHLTSVLHHLLKRCLIFLDVAILCNRRSKGRDGVWVRDVLDPELTACFANDRSN